MIEPKFRGAIPKEEWIQRTTNRSPRGRWVEEAPSPMPLWGKAVWALYVAAIMSVIYAAARM